MSPGILNSLIEPLVSRITPGNETPYKERNLLMVYARTLCEIGEFQEAYLMIELHIDHIKENNWLKQGALLARAMASLGIKELKEGKKYAS